MSRAKTVEEIREELLAKLRGMVEYWAGRNGSNVPLDTSIAERLDGLVFSILNVFDGNTLPLPGLDIIPHSDPKDRLFYVSQGENWYPSGTVINNCQLHEQWYTDEWKKRLNPP